MKNSISRKKSINKQILEKLTSIENLLKRNLSSELEMAVNSGDFAGYSPYSTVPAVEGSEISDPHENDFEIARRKAEEKRFKKTKNGYIYEPKEDYETPNSIKP